MSVLIELIGLAHNTQPEYVLRGAMNYYNSLEKKLPQRPPRPKLNKNSTPDEIRNFAKLTEDFNLEMGVYYDAKRLVWALKDQIVIEVRNYIIEVSGLSSLDLTHNTQINLYEMMRSDWRCNCEFDFVEVYEQVSNLVKCFER
jgi:hypothetical protein